MAENKMTMDMLKMFQAYPLELKIEKSKLRIREWVQHFGEDGVYVSFSGGKDSTVLLDLVRSMYPDIPAVFSDTGLEFPEIRNFVKSTENVTWLKPKLTFKQVLDKCGYPVVSKEQAQWIHRIREGGRNKNEFERVMLGKMQNGSDTIYRLSSHWKYLLDAPFKVGAGCCMEMKKKPLAEYHKISGRVPIIGTMAEESALRTSSWIKSGCNAFDNKKAVSMPISFWTEQDIWEYIKTRKIPYSEIYDMGYKRTGCIFCAFGAHLEKEPNRFQLLQKTHPKLWRYCMKDKDKGGLGMREVLEHLGVPYESYD